MLKPIWMNDEGLKTLSKGYLLPNESPFDMYYRLSSAASSYYLFIEDLSQQDLKEGFYDILCKGWLSPASPVAANLGTKRGLPVSCFGITVPNNIYGITGAMQEAAILSKQGGGLGINLSDLKGMSNVVTWAKGFDWVANSISQGGIRRGAVALYLDIEHRDINEFLDAKDLLVGDTRTKLDCNIAVVIRDSFIQRLRDGDQSAKEVFVKVLELRMKYGSPYLCFLDNAIRQDPECYKINGLESSPSQLCSEIHLHNDDNHSYSCVLSSLNLDKYDEWKNWTLKGHSLTQLAIYFLDAVCQEFIEKGSKIKGVEKAVRAAIKGRPLGLGVMGLHSLYQKLSLPFESSEARQLNREIFSLIRSGADLATATLAKEFGEPEWCKGSGRRNTHCLAIAPTTASSVLCNAGSAGIEPIIGNYYAMSGAKGTFSRKNKYLENLLEEKRRNNNETWASILKNEGSVQHLDFLTEKEKDIFKTAFEINQYELILQASERQKYIDQGQSLNIFLNENTPAEFLVDLHLTAYDINLKCLYYIRSNSSMKTAAKNNHSCFIYTRPNCPFCIAAKNLLNEMDIPYTEAPKQTGKVPEIWIDGELLDDGFKSLCSFLAVDVPVSLADPNLREPNCQSCDG
ncbi:MAG: ribonucleotide reductase N-terminal alpha domain-containing protein [Fusobacteriaceae bacterium]